MIVSQILLYVIVTGVLALALFLPRGILSVLDSVKLRRIELKFGNYGLNFTSGLRKTRKATGVEYTRLFNTSLAVVAIGVYIVKQGAELGARADTTGGTSNNKHPAAPLPGEVITAYWS